MRGRNASPGAGGRYVRRDSAEDMRGGTVHRVGQHSVKKKSDGTSYGTGGRDGQVSGRRRSRGKGRLSLIAGIAMLLVGLGLLLYPAVTAAVAQRDVDEALAAWRSGAVGADGTADARAEDAASDADALVAHGEVAVGQSASETAGDAGQAFRAKEGDATYDQLVQYNARILEGEGGQINDPFAFDGDDLAELGLPDGISGSVSIPAMGVDIPLYLGATADNMVYGAGIVAGTSMPLGEETSNTVIAAHRGGYFGLPMFRDIEDLQVGDTVTVTTPWDELTYRVSEFKIVSPDDTASVGIQQGRDLVTLLTCHPYDEHPSRHRMLVFCERVDSSQAQAAPSPLDAAVAQILPGSASDSPLLALEDALRLVGLGILLATGVFLVVDSVRRRRRAAASATATGPDGGRAGGLDEGSSAGLHFKG